MTEVKDKDELAARIGQAARERRKAARMTLSDVAKSAGMSVSHLSNVENGLTLVSLPMLAKLAAALGTSLAELTRDDNFVFRGAALPMAPSAMEQLSHPSLLVEAHGLALAEGEVDTLETSGERDVFVYVLEGDIDVALDTDDYHLGAGDALDARAPQRTVLTARSAARVFRATTPVVKVG